ncbi:MAG: RluA family pseudouridine synthase [Planctomycetes bacterium]|nr:RluA family pseudouridine synthase [Planctomycetota bacterium]
MDTRVETRRFTLSDAVRGSRLDHVVAGLIPGISRSRLQQWIRSGQVRFGGAVVIKPGLLLLEGGALEVDVELETVVPPAPVAAADLVVVHADRHIVVVDKPAGLLTHRNSARSEPGLADLVVERLGSMGDLGDPLRPGIAHRIDRETSGLLVLGRTDEALRALKDQFRARTVEKTYTALVHGSPRFDTDWIESWLGRSENVRDRIGTLPEGEGRFASTYYETRERFDKYALIAVFPKTGRTHQIRVHMTAAGMPLVGDVLYKPRGRTLPKPPPEAPVMTRHALHAAALTFTHPATGERVSFTAPLAADMDELVQWLRAHAPAQD